MLHGWLRTKGIEIVHAAAVGIGDDCVLLVGKAGSGKSWTALAAASSGLQVLADDYCLVSPGTPACISSVYNAAKTHADALDRLPFLGEMVSNPGRPDDDKAVYFLHEHMPDRLLLEADLQAIVIPRRTTTAGAGAEPGAARGRARSPRTEHDPPTPGRRRGDTRTAHGARAQRPDLLPRRGLGAPRDRAGDLAAPRLAPN